MSITLSIGAPAPLLVAGAFALAISLWLLIRRSQRLPFPPGPSPDPVIGNLRQMGSGNLSLVFAKWGKEHGELSSLYGGGNQPYRPLNVGSQDRSTTCRCWDNTLWSSIPPMMPVNYSSAAVGYTQIDRGWSTSEKCTPVVHPYCPYSHSLTKFLA
jgi:hypothetical protein